MLQFQIFTKNSLNDQKIFHHGHENNSDDLRPI